MRIDLAGAGGTGSCFGLNEIGWERFFECVVIVEMDPCSSGVFWCFNGRLRYWRLLLVLNLSVIE